MSFDQLCQSIANQLTTEQALRLYELIDGPLPADIAAMTDDELLADPPAAELAAGITPTQHERNEWSRLAQAAYAADRNDLGHRYSIAASLPNGARLTCKKFDALQGPYRAWLVGGFESIRA